MSNETVNNTEQRKTSDILLSLEAKILSLTQAITASDMNNKLILDRLNKLLVQQNAPTVSSTTSKQPETSRIQVAQPSVEVSQTPITKRKLVTTKPTAEEKKEKPNQAQQSSNATKIPVGQRITDHTGKDLFMADVTITNMDTGEFNKVKTSAVGKWQAYLPTGKYSIHISKIIDAETLNKIESLQEIEITPQMKSLQLPIAIIKR